ncbi:hypothetical protein, partial [Micromonospora sp. S4605]|uniref:hypothetical protein n=1 Tax=Micromonospora sp. S4605 TaxID=1420897 RepID=UPI001E53A348
RGAVPAAGWSARTTPPEAVTPGAARRILNRDQEAIRRVLDGGPDRVRRGPGGLRRGLVRRRRTTLLALAVVATVSAAALVAGLLSWAPDPPEQARTLTAAEHERLAAMRVTNYRDLRSGLHVTTGDGAARTELIGWVDWSRPLVYLDVGGPGAGAERGLLQATPTVVLLRPDPTAVPTPAPPPLVPPADRWRLHDLPAGHGLARLLDLLFRLAADRTEPAGATPEAARWLGRDTIGAEPVDILQAPPPSGLTTAEHPRYWLDQSARLHRLETRLTDVGPVTVQLNRTNRPTLRPVDALGGRPGLPRALTAAEQDRLNRLAGRLRARGGATVTLTAPIGTDTNLRGAGWLSWTRRTAYLTVADLGRPNRRTLLHHGPAGTARAELPATAVPGPAETPGRPPLPRHRDGWRAGPARADDLDLLVDAALRAGGSAGQRGQAVRVRGDSLDGRTVDVVELRASRALLRYWIDRSGLLRRLELRTRPGAWAQLDLTPGSVPRWTAPAPGRARPADG